MALDREHTPGPGERESPVEKPSRRCLLLRHQSLPLSEPPGIRRKHLAEEADKGGNGIGPLAHTGRLQGAEELGYEVWARPLVIGLGEAADVSQRPEGAPAGITRLLDLGCPQRRGIDPNVV